MTETKEEQVEDEENGSESNNEESGSETKEEEAGNDESGSEPNDEENGSEPNDDAGSILLVLNLFLLGFRSTLLFKILIGSGSR